MWSPAEATELVAARSTGGGEGGEGGEIAGATDEPMNSWNLP